MGLNISVYKINNHDRDEHGNLVDRPIEYEEWDSLRHGLDRIFVPIPIKWDYLYYAESMYQSDVYYQRPNDIDEVLEMFKNSENRDRYIDILKKMKTDKTLWFYFGLLTEKEFSMFNRRGKFSVSKEMIDIIVNKNTETF